MLDLSVHVRSAAITVIVCCNMSANELTRYKPPTRATFHSMRCKVPTETAIRAYFNAKYTLVDETQDLVDRYSTESSWAMCGRSGTTSSNLR